MARRSAPLQVGGTKSERVNARIEAGTRLARTAHLGTCSGREEAGAKRDTAPRANAPALAPGRGLAGAWRGAPAVSHALPAACDPGGGARQRELLPLAEARLSAAGSKSARPIDALRCK